MRPCVDAGETITLVAVADIALLRIGVYFFAFSENIL
jgi:hypothetical protein